MSKKSLYCINIVILSPIAQTDKKAENNFLLKYSNILKEEEKNIILHNNLSTSRWYRNDLHLNLNGTIMLAGNLLLRIQMFWDNMDSNKWINLSID